MKCKQVQAVLAIAPREWSEAERQQIEAHLPTCAACAAIARDYAQQADRLTALPRVSLSMAQQQAILAQVLRVPQYPWSRRLVNAFGVAAGILILGVLVISLLWVFNNPTSLSLTATVTSVLTPTMTSTPTPASPTRAPAVPPPPAPLPTVALPDGTFATATPAPVDPIAATAFAVQQATIAASRATLIAHATASPFPTAGPSTIQVDRTPFKAIAERGGLSLEVSVPKLSYVAGESGLAVVTLRNNTAETVYAESLTGLVVLDERGQTPEPWPWSPASFPGWSGGRRDFGAKIEPGQIFTTTVSFRAPPGEQAQGHQFSLWVDTLFREPLPGLPDIPADISHRFEAGPLPLQVTAPDAAQQLKANLQIDQSGWHLQVTDQAGQPPAGPLQGEIEAAWSNGAMAGPLTDNTRGFWSGEWPEYRAAQNAGPLIVRAWVAAPGYVTAAVIQTLPANSALSSAEIGQRFGTGEPPTRHTFASLEEAQAALKATIYQMTSLPAGAILDGIVHWDTAYSDNQHHMNLTQTYRLPGEDYLALNQQSTTEDNAEWLWGTARYAPDVQQVIVNNAPAYTIQRFGFWLLDWKMSEQVFELRVPMSAVSIEQLVDIAAGVQPLR